MKKSSLVSSVVLAMGVVSTLAAASGADKLTKTFKNVIVMIPDGCGMAHYTLARWYNIKKNGEGLALDALNVGTVRTYGSNSYITDSAPAATAFACGYKSFDKHIGILPASATYTMPGVQIPASMQNGPVASVLEGARLSGRATGLIATSTLTHATPADYCAHWYSRANEALIQEQQVYQGVDVVFGGGKKYLLPESASGSRKDAENLADSLTTMGYTMVNTKQQLAALPSSASKVWGQFAMSAMARDVDRTLESFADQPSLADMTSKAIELLSSSAKGQSEGFFLMVEGSQVDWASHANEPVGTVTELLAFDRAVKVAVDFAKNSNTLVLVMPDHDNGGLSLGSSRTDATYSSRPLDSLLTAPFMAATLTGVGVESVLGANRSNTSAIQSAVSQYYGIHDLTSDELAAIAASKIEGMEYALGPIMSKRTDMAWTTTGHTGNDVPLHYYGTNDHFGTIQNSDIAWICAKAMDFDLTELNDTLFVDAATLFEGATLTLDTVGVESSKGSLSVTKEGRSALLPFNKNEIIVNGVKFVMNGLTIYSLKAKTVYVPKMALDLFNGNSTPVMPSLDSRYDVKPMNFELFNIKGQLIAKTSASEYRHAFASKKLANGTYVVRVDNKMVERFNVLNGAVALNRTLR
jgi:alkaline phosphatase